MSSRHSRAAALIAAGFYRGLSSFRELEARIAALPEELARGDAFEIFVEGYLWTMRVFQSADLWLVGQVPLDVRRALNLPADAKGIDGVFRTKAGQDVPYQVKFRISRAMLGVAEVATFLGLTERASDRLLVSNANRCAPDVANRDGLRLLCGSDFDALAPEDLAAIAAWLDERPLERSRAAPRADQAKALAGIADALQTHPRATVVMPCGTGKTLVQLWAAERLSPRTVLVLVPSLALLSQTLGEWSHHTSWGDHFEYLCVCSDPTVSAEQDAISIRSTDVPFHVDTDPAIVRRFLSRPATHGVRVVFSTYQSASVVARGLRGLAPFDLGIFDEAHKTTGVLGGTFALDNARLRIRKRLFFTATPRHIDIRHRDREGDFPVVSMDDPAVYGPRAYVQTFADAVALGIICDYRVVVAVIDPAEVDSFAMHHGITLVKGDQQATRWVATQIAVSKAIRATGATRVITFHTRIQQAALFASDTPRGIRQYLDGFIVDHVNGAQRVADRKDILSGFRDAQRRLVTNARCLTEGVDLPAVDMVVFSNPRRSRVDIVQAVGRAMRKPRDSAKTMGDVVVPILLAPHETADLAEACAKTDWEDVIDVLGALREQDARLDEIIRVQQVAKGRGEVFNPGAFAQRVQVLGPLVALEVLERHVAAVVLKSLGTSWDERYGQLVEFKLREGHCNVPARYPENEQLGTWLDVVRQSRKRGRLSSDRIARLDALGVAWDVRKTAWEAMFQALVAFKAQHGNCWVPQIYPESPRLLKWMNIQRSRKRRGSLSQDRVDLLTKAGFPWDPHDSFWEEMFQSLVRFKAQHGHCKVPRHYPESPQLSTWVQTQRTLKERGKLSGEDIGRLEELGFVWQPHRTIWQQRLEQLAEFKVAYGHCNVPAVYPDNPPLGRWLDQQRQARKGGTLSEGRLAQLEALGVAWEPLDDFWEQRLQDLETFKAHHGHCNVPVGYPENPLLGTWLNNQRGLKRGRNCLQTVSSAWNKLASSGSHKMLSGSSGSRNSKRSKHVREKSTSHSIIPRINDWRPGCPISASSKGEERYHKTGSTGWRRWVSSGGARVRADERARFGGPSPAMARTTSQGRHLRSDR
jgi:superfamily II DNA or RNA helicase